jgi:hypothetical protein
MRRWTYHGTCFVLDCLICQRRDLDAALKREARAAAAGCRCGRKECDCARWEQIFHERFEDPEYYTRETHAPRSSPFADL